MIFASNPTLAETLTAVATLVTAIGIAIAQLRTGSKVKQVHESVGTSNGTDLVAMAQQIATLEKYTHDSIHNLTKMLTPVAALAPSDPDLLNAAVANKNAERAAATEAATVTTIPPPGLTPPPQSP